MIDMPSPDRDRMTELLDEAHVSPFDPPEEMVQAIQVHCEHLIAQGMLVRARGELANVQSGEMTAQESQQFVTLLMMGALIHGWHAGVSYRDALP